MPWPKEEELHRKLEPEQLDRAILRRQWAKKAIKFNARRGSREWIEWSVEAQTTSFYLNVLINFPETKSLPKTK